MNKISKLTAHVAGIDLDELLTSSQRISRPDFKGLGAWMEKSTLQKFANSRLGPADASHMLQAL
jgi:hypothetical protein